MKEGPSFEYRRLKVKESPLRREQNTTSSVRIEYNDAR